MGAGATRQCFQDTSASDLQATVDELDANSRERLEVALEQVAMLDIVRESVRVADRWFYSEDSEDGHTSFEITLELVQEQLQFQRKKSTVSRIASNDIVGPFLSRGFSCLKDEGGQTTTIVADFDSFQLNLHVEGGVVRRITQPGDFTYDGFYGKDREREFVSAEEIAARKAREEERWQKQKEEDEARAAQWRAEQAEKKQRKKDEEEWDAAYDKSVKEGTPPPPPLPQWRAEKAEREQRKKDGVKEGTPPPPPLPKSVKEGNPRLPPPLRRRAPSF